MRPMTILNELDAAMATALEEGSLDSEESTVLALGLAQRLCMLALAPKGATEDQVNQAAASLVYELGKLDS